LKKTTLKESVLGPSSTHISFTSFLFCLFLLEVSHLKHPPRNKIPV